MSNVKISVIIPLYNASRFIVHTINALLAQTFKDLEILVMDDCSTDEGPELVKTVFASENKVIYYRMEQNGGPAKARNRGINLAKGEYIAFLDSDDGIMPDALEKLYDAAIKFNADVVQSAGSYVPVMCPAPDDIMTVSPDMMVKHTKDTLTSEPRLLDCDPVKKLDMVMSGALGGNVWGKLFRKSFLTENDIYMPDLKMSEDIIMCLECALLARSYVLTPYHSIIYRMIGDSLSKGAKSPAFMRKVLDAVFGGDVAVRKFMSAHPVFRDCNGNVDCVESLKQQDRLIGWMDQAMEDLYIRPCYQSVGKAALLSDPSVHEIFEKYFGLLSGYVEYQFYQNHDNLPEVIDYFDPAFAYEGLKMRLKEIRAESITHG